MSTATASRTKQQPRASARPTPFRSPDESACSETIFAMACAVDSFAWLSTMAKTIAELASSDDDHGNSLDVNRAQFAEAASLGGEQ